MKVNAQTPQVFKVQGGGSVSLGVVLGKGPQGLPGPGSAAWTAGQAVTSGAVRQAPDGSWIKSTATRTTGATFDATEQGFWTAVAATSGTIEAAALSASFAHLPADAYNVLNTGTPERDAIADGSPHPLSERFATLAAAQAVFPRATALTEQIDHHAIQWALDNQRFIVAPCHQGDYRIHGTLFTAASDSPVGLGNQTFLMPGGPYSIKPTTWVGTGGIGAWFASGNTRGQTTGFTNGSSANFPACDNMTLQVRIDANRANVAAAGISAIQLIHCNNLDIDAVVKNASGSGVVLYGVSDAYTRNVNLRRVWVTNCAGARGVQVSLRHRNVTYTDVKSWGNVQDGVFIDHSEAVTSAVQAWENGGTGIEVHNVTRCTIKGLYADSNGKHGILFSGMWCNEGADLIATRNGQAAGGVSGAGWADIKFDNRNGSYGLSRSSQFDGIVCGYYSGGTGDAVVPSSADYALSVDDSITGDLSITNVKVIGAGLLGEVRLPSTRGELTVQTASPGKSLRKYVAGGNEQIATKAADQTVNNSTTVVNDNDLKFHVAAGQTWQFEATLAVVGASVNADFKVGVSTPASSSGRLYMVQGTATTSTGGSGPALAGTATLNLTIAVGAFASTNTVVLRGVVTATNEGDVVLQWAQNTATAEDLTVASGSTLVAKRLS
jgi:hypothetical protein